jgi:hypothetical protein
MNQHSPPSEVQLEYENPRSRPAWSRVNVDALQRAALKLATIPAMVGLAVLGGYWLTENSWFVLLGMLMLGIGAMSVVVGFCLTGISLLVAGRRGELFRPVVRRAVVTILLLLANLPLAYFCDWAGEYLMNHPYCTFILANTGTKSIDSGVLHFGLHDDAFGEIKPGATTSVSRRMSGDGQFSVDVTSGGQMRKMLVQDAADSDSIPGRFVRIDIDDTGAERKY